MVIRTTSSSITRSNTHHNNGDGGDHGGGGSCVWFLCCMFIVSSSLFVILAMLSVASTPFGFTFMAPSATATSSSSKSAYYYSVHSMDLQSNAISAVSEHHFDAVFSTSTSNLSLNSSSHLPINDPRTPIPTVIKEEEKSEEGLAKARTAIRLAKARAAIRNAASRRNFNFSLTALSGGVFRNPAAFFQSYIEMEKRFKVYVYEEGELPIVHYGPCKNIYASEGRFIHEMEHGGNRFKTRNPHSAHVYFMPFSVTWMVKYLYKPYTYNVTPLKEFASDYVRVISTKHPFWNRTQGADHFMLSCHDWGPHASRGNPFLYNTSIRVLCNANSSEGFNPRKDVSLPEVQLYDGDVSPKIRSPPPANNSRPYLAFFAGGFHGPVRPILFNHWKGRDHDVRVYDYLPKGLDYYTLMLQSKFCLCPSGHEVASPRIVEAIYAECVPVILSEHYILPFSDVLRWEAFSIKVEISEIPRLKEILMAISDDEYMKLKEGLRSVRRHFVLNQPAQRFDMFHMILHSVWLRRINLRLGQQR